MMLSDSLLCAHKRFGTRLHHLEEAGQHLHACLCVASGASLLMPAGQRGTDSAIGLAVGALSGGEQMARDQLSADPVVRILVVRAKQSTAQCREDEQYPRTVRDRQRSPLIRSLETPWTICDLEDVVTQRRRRRRFGELEVCGLRDQAGLYSESGDVIHFRKVIAKAAGDELIKAIQRTALARYGAELSPGGGAMLLVLSAGWNSDGESFHDLDRHGCAWRKVELIALAELCALNGQRLSVIFRKMRELLRRGQEDHRSFLKQRLPVDVSPLPPRAHTEGLLQHGEEDKPRPGEVQSLKRKRQLDAGLERKRLGEAMFFAEMMDLPVEVAVVRLASAGGDVAAALDAAGAEASHLSAPLQSQHSDGPLSQLLQMGFARVETEVALQSSGGDVQRALDLLCSDAP